MFHCSVTTYSYIYIYVCVWVWVCVYIYLSSVIFFFFKESLLFFCFCRGQGAALGLHCCVRAFSSCSEQGLPFVAVRGLLIAVASLVAEHRL